MKEILLNWFSPAVTEQLARYAQLLVEWNKKINLTAITEEKEIAVKHFYDCIYPARFLDLTPGLKVIDVGTGAGFPGLALKIAYPELQVTLLDSLQKRTIFLQTVIDELGLKGIEVIHGRAEEVARQKGQREKYDLAVSRAVAALPVLLEYTAPFVKVGGRIAAWKGPNLLEEKESAHKALVVLGADWLTQYDYELPFAMGKRALGVMQKISSTPGTYPRKAGTPEKRPIQ
ncbi:16S rRNA m(7)G-527 methyltransferase [Carboxydocella thermautotrophica]|nr:16S rRNA m(7)G-527 methyltransferase [Carboxydocella thermautotrophica]